LIAIATFKDIPDEVKEIAFLSVGVQTKNLDWGKNGDTSKTIYQGIIFRNIAISE
jgi:hypothetical protein